MFFSDFSIIHCVLSLLYVCVGVILTLSMMIVSYRLPFSILQWVVDEEEKQQQQAKKSFDFEDNDSLLLSKLFNKNK